MRDVLPARRNLCRSGWTARLLALCLALTAAHSWPAAAQPLVASEAALKAAFVYRIALFVEWPPETAGSNRPFQICVFGADHGWAVPVGVVLAVLGSLASGVAAWQHRRFYRTLPENELPQDYRGEPGLVLGFGSAIIGFVLSGLLMV